MHAWPTRVPHVLQILDPQSAPRLVLERLWIEVASWKCIAAIWWRDQAAGRRAEPLLVGGPLPDAEEIAALAPPATAPIATDGLPVVARLVREGERSPGVVLVAHHGCEDAAVFLAESVARWTLERARGGSGGVGTEPADDQLADELPTSSPAMQAVLRAAAKVAASQASVLIQGETGTGKELLARWIHRRSPRAARPLIVVNTAALAAGIVDSELFGHARGAFTGAERARAGLFEAADGGTLFLDEIGEIPLETQLRLLRVLQERAVCRLGEQRAIPVDVRLIAATNRDLEAEVRAGRFREDLYYRLQVVVLTVPPLRQRREDIPLLVNHFLQKYNRLERKCVEEVPEAVRERLARYHWPGNVRELENCIHRAVVMAHDGVLREELLPLAVRRAADGERAAEPPAVELRRALERYAEAESADLARLTALIERALIPWALTRERGVKLRAAHRLGINRVTLDRKLLELGLAVRRGVGVVEPPASWEAEERARRAVPVPA
ncbi:MAG: sigma 54-interacting transcriptional regulator [Planctomycetota bacterium]|nr:sigma 54-interacting transcriptional regulator [Planctomycetota bacterium]